MSGGTNENWYFPVGFHVTTLTLQARPHRMGLPTKTHLAPRARAFSTSLPVRIPPSRYTSTFPFTVATTSVRASIWKQETSVARRTSLWTLRESPVSGDSTAPRVWLAPGGLSWGNASWCHAWGCRCCQSRVATFPRPRDSFQATPSCHFLLWQSSGVYSLEETLGIS